MAEVHNFTCPSGFEPEKVKQADQSQISAYLDEEDEDKIELWMIKAPLNFDISLLSGHELEEQFNIPLEERSDIEFVGKATTNHPTCKTFQTVFPHKTKNKLKIGPSFKGYVDIVQSVKIHNNDHVSFPQEKHCEIPSNLKQRYIPYGSNSPAKNSSTPKIKEKSKKRKRCSESLSFSIPDLDASQVSQAELENLPSKKRKKKKCNESLMSVDVMDNSCLMPQTSVPFSMVDLHASQSNHIDLEESSLKKKKHKKKKELDKSVTSVDIRDDNSCSLLQTPVCISMVDLDASQSFDLNESSSKKKKKKHKEKKEFSETLSVDMTEDSCFMAQTPVSISMVDLDASQSFDLNESSSKKKKKKHKEKKEFSETLSVDMTEDSCFMAQTPDPFSMVDLHASQSNHIDLEESSLKKKKHKKKKELDKSVTSVDMRDDNSSSLLQTPVCISMVDLDASQSFDLNESSSKKKKHKEKKEFSETLSVDMTEDSCFMAQTPDPFSMVDLHASQSNHIDLEESSLKKKKHKKKKELDKSVTSVDMRDDNSSSLLQTPVCISMVDLDASQSFDLNESSSKKKKKKHKEKKEFSETLSVDMTEDSCFMAQTPEVTVPESAYIDAQEESLTMSGKKKKKKHKAEKVETADDGNVQMENGCNGDMDSSLRKKKSEVCADSAHLNRISVDTAEVLQKKDSGIGSLEMEFDNSNSTDFVPELEESFSSHKKKKKHKKHSFEENSLNETYLQLNIKRKNENKMSENNPHHNDTVNKYLDSSSKTKKHNLFGTFEDSVSLVNGFPIYTKESVKKDGRINSLQMELGIVNSVDAVDEKTVSLHKKKKKHKEK